MQNKNTTTMRHVARLSLEAGFVTSLTFSDVSM